MLLKAPSTATAKLSATLMCKIRLVSVRLVIASGVFSATFLVARLKILTSILSVSAQQGAVTSEDLLVTVQTALSIIVSSTMLPCRAGIIQADLPVRLYAPISPTALPNQPAAVPALSILPPDLIMALIIPTSFTPPIPMTATLRNSSARQCCLQASPRLTRATTTIQSLSAATPSIRPAQPLSSLMTVPFPKVITASTA